jgi:hypothetical protein
MVQITTSDLSLSPAPLSEPCPPPASSYPPPPPPPPSTPQQQLLRTVFLCLRLSPQSPVPHARQPWPPIYRPHPIPSTYPPPPPLPSPLPSRPPSNPLSTNSSHLAPPPLPVPAASCSSSSSSRPSSQLEVRTRRLSPAAANHGKRHAILGSNLGLRSASSKFQHSQFSRHMTTLCRECVIDTADARVHKRPEINSTCQSYRSFQKLHVNTPAPAPQPLPCRRISPVSTRFLGFFLSPASPRILPRCRSLPSACFR